MFAFGEHPGVECDRRVRPEKDVQAFKRSQLACVLHTGHKLVILATEHTLIPLAALDERAQRALVVKNYAFAALGLIEMLDLV